MGTEMSIANSQWFIDIKFFSELSQDFMGINSQIS